ncbi:MULTISPECIES: hypothetical protein [unclassified Pseudoalteromonas]|uniref:hypothetical protein n=1 Tax=unclassified Pseudoalteromonas TaxID=194690 RepID=UPI003014F740
MSDPISLEITVTPKADGNWVFSNEDQPVELKIAKGKSAKLTYKIVTDEDGWSFAENGTFFTEAQDNFNYNLSSEVSKDHRSVTVTIQAVSLEHTISSEQLQKLMAEPTIAMPMELTHNHNSKVDFRLVAENETINEGIRYFSQDPRVIIDEPDVPV